MSKIGKHYKEKDSYDVTENDVEDYIQEIKIFKIYI